MRAQHWFKLLAVVAIAAMGPAGASELQKRASSADCPEEKGSMLGSAVADWPGDGSFFDLGRRSPLLMP
jgi:hypothetical protein